MNKFYKNEETNITVDLNHFKMYGPGIYLFFSFLKSLSLIFLMIAILSLIPCLYNYSYGNYSFRKDTSPSIYFTKTTIGNFDSSTSLNMNRDKLYNVIPSMLIILSIVIFVFYWMQKSSNEVE